MKNYFPPVDSLLELEPEEIGSYLFLYLKYLVKERNQNKLNRMNIINSSNPSLNEYAGSNITAQKVALLLSEAWIWLLQEGFIAPMPDEQNFDWVFITRRGQSIQDQKDFKKFFHIKLLPKNELVASLVQKAWPHFLRGDFDIAIFAAFREVEVKIREAAHYSSKDIGSSLARKAFDPDNGPLTDYALEDKAEREAYSHIFAGVLGAFKNPSSHREVNYEDPVIAASLILFANTLIRIIERIALKKCWKRADINNCKHS